MSRPGPYRQPVASSRPRESLSTSGNRGSERSPRGGKARQYYPRRAALPVRCGSCLQPKSVAVSHDECSSRLVSPVLSPAWISVSSSLLERATMSQKSSLTSTHPICLMSADGGHPLKLSNVSVMFSPPLC